MAKVPIMQIWDDATQQYVAIPSIQGAKGDPGFSPTVSISVIPDGHRVIITEEAGSQSFDVMDGSIGPQGPQGEIGPQGEQGPAGQDGASYTVKGLYATLSALQAAHPTGSAGDAWFVGTADSNVVYQWDVDKASWVNVGALKGPKGDKGDTGPQGPKGDTGDTGPQGPQGETGAVGADGKSAYASAQDGGYTGTEAQFNTDLAAVGGKQAKITASGLLKGDGAGGITTATKGTDYAGASETVTATLLAASWTGSSAPYTYTLAVTGVTANSNQELLPALNITSEQLTALQAANIQDGGQAVNSVTLTAFGDKPTIDLPIRVIVRGDS